MVNIAVIPARGGSKRIPKKNMVEFDGQPLIAKTIQCALDSKIFDQVIVSTDDIDVAEFAKSMGAYIPGLRGNYFDDNSPASKVTLYELDRFYKGNGNFPNTVFQLMPTCPFRTVEDIETVYQFLSDNENRSVITCHSPVGSNIWWTATLNPNLEPNFLFPENLKKRSQDLPKTFVPNGAIWASKVSTLTQYANFYNPAIVFCEIPWLSGFDIDTPEELDIAKALIAKGTRWSQ